MRVRSPRTAGRFFFGYPPERPSRKRTFETGHFRSSRSFAGPTPITPDGRVAQGPFRTDRRRSGRDLGASVGVAPRGSRGLRGGMSIVRLLAKHRGLRNRSSPPPLSVEQILAWADTHRQTAPGSRPTSGTGAVEDAPGETWNAIDIALSKGTRGLPSGSGLSTLLEKHRHVPKRRRYSLLTVEMILAWVDEHHRQTGAWPNPGQGW